MSSLADEIVIEPNTKRGKQENKENEDRLSDLPDCVILHVLSFLNTKNAVQTCFLSTRWKHLWKRIPALILHSSGTYSSGTYTGFYTLKSFDKYVSRILTLRDGSVALQALDFDRCGSIEPHFLKRIANYVFSRSTQLQRLGISVNGDSSLILPCISSCRALTSLKLSIHPKGPNACGKTLFPKSLNLPALTILDLTNFSFCASDNDCRAEPFSAFNSLNSLIIRYCNKVCGNTLSSVKQLDIDADTNSSGDPPLILFSWLLDLPNIKSLTVTASALQVLSLVPDLLKLKFPSLCNLKSLKVKLKPLSFGASHIFRAAKLMNKTRKEATKIRKALKAGFEPSETIPDGILDFLLQNSREANVDIIDYCSRSRKVIQKDTSTSEDMVEKSRSNTCSPPLDNGS